MVYELFSFISGFLPKDCTFIDVGAYHGSLTEGLLKAFPNSRGILFEPTLDSFNYLMKKFSYTNNLKMFNSALGDKIQEAEFYLLEDGTQNSILQLLNKNVKFNKTKIKVDTLDSVLGSVNFLSHVDFIKIDTQGNDLSVLRGAKETILKNSPIVLTEAIFIPLYKNQCSYFDQFNFMNNLHYTLAGIYNIHYCENGQIAFADLLFIPPSIREIVNSKILSKQSFFCADNNLLAEENRTLKSICEERLELINRLSEEAERRLEIINQRDSEIKKLKDIHK
ncbi:MAG: FkbM family methyltransferase [Ignavibacteriales bacterium]|nr:FkbM family methyltransferase [Ignavibacteriales bacterium]